MRFRSRRPVSPNCLVSQNHHKPLSPNGNRPKLGCVSAHIEEVLVMPDQDGFLTQAQFGHQALCSESPFHKPLWSRIVSNRAAAASTRRSRPRAAMICNPRGKPLDVRPQGKERAGVMA